MHNNATQYSRPNMISCRARPSCQMRIRNPKEKSNIAFLLFFSKKKNLDPHAFSACMVPSDFRP